MTLLKNPTILVQAASHHMASAVSPYLPTLPMRLHVSCHVRKYSGSKFNSSAHDKTTLGYSTVKKGKSSQAETNGPWRVMPIGGSVTYGVGSSDGNGYRKALFDTLQSSGHDLCMVGSRKSGSMKHNQHEGWRGYRLDQIETKARRSVVTFLPNIFTVNAGSNDCIQDFQIQDFGKRMGAFLDYLWDASPLSTVILSTLLINANKEVNSRVTCVNDQIWRLAKMKATEQRRIILADMQSSEGPQIQDLVDGTHPGDLGYEKMAKIWLTGFEHAQLQGFL